MSLKIGDKAPNFKVPDQNDSPIQLSDYIGQKVVLYFYPKDNTPGCTNQACNLRDNFDALTNNGYIILGVSTDNQKRHQNFIKKFDLPFSLLADTEKVVHNLYGTWKEKQLYGKKYMGTVRTTFIINEQGNIENIINKVKTKEHFSQIIS
ncbi:MAG: thioredoxin-dependent thiol peroxidase [Cyclobacteriaceae bacterium]|nr:thioredoxin-dependent thiol peroxidase [Cyclobacteriaceae bacterium]